MHLSELFKARSTVSVYATKWGLKRFHFYGVWRGHKRGRRCVVKEWPTAKRKVAWHGVRVRGNASVSMCGWAVGRQRVGQAWECSNGPPDWRIFPNRINFPFERHPYLSVNKRRNNCRSVPVSVFMYLIKLTLWYFSSREVLEANNYSRPLYRVSVIMGNWKIHDSASRISNCGAYTVKLPCTKCLYRSCLSPIKRH